jgi:hypothetical protein
MPTKRVSRNLFAPIGPGGFGVILRRNELAITENYADAARLKERSDPFGLLSAGRNAGYFQACGCTDDISNVLPVNASFFKAVEKASEFSTRYHSGKKLCADTQAFVKPSYQVLNIKLLV